MNILIIEDEQPAGERIIAMLHEFDPSITILGSLKSVQESVAWLRSHPSPDVIIADIQLNDGISLEIFKQHPVTAPLIFTTAFDEYILKAFEFNSIDYLLKPVDKNKLFHSLKKYQTLKHHFSGNLTPLLEQLQSVSQNKNRIVVKKGADFIALKMEHIAYFYTEHKISFLVDKENKRYIVDKPLNELVEELDEKKFFRINRKYIANIESIVKFRSVDNGKILVELTPSIAEEVLVSKENASLFKSWIEATL